MTLLAAAAAKTFCMAARATMKLGRVMATTFSPESLVPTSYMEEEEQMSFKVSRMVTKITYL